MPLSDNRHELTLTLARAFDQAWSDYYEPGREGTLSKDIVRLTLAKYLVALATDGVDDQDQLAVAGLRHLLSLTPAADAPGVKNENSGAKAAVETPELSDFHSHIDDAHATFLPGYRIPFRRLG